MAVLLSIQDLINDWGSLMEVTVGFLSIEKSWCYLVEFVWKRGKWVSNDAGVGVDLVSDSSTGESISLKRLQAHEGLKMLGYG